MACRRDDNDVSPHLEMPKQWKEAFEDIFIAFSPDKWKLGPTDTDMPKGWQQFNDSAKVKFLCSCGNSWTSMAGRIIFWFKKIEESERKVVAKTIEAKGENVKVVDESERKIEEKTNEAKREKVKEVEESERKIETKTNEAKGENVKEEGEDSGSASIKDKNNLPVYSLRFKLYGQQCQKCEDEDFQKPLWYQEEVRKVLNNVHKKIGEVFYGYPSQEIDNSKRHGRPQRSHDSRRCQACREGHCTQ